MFLFQFNSECLALLTVLDLQCGRDELINHLRPFAQMNREVTEADIRAFFEEKMQSGH